MKEIFEAIDKELKDKLPFSQATILNGVIKYCQARYTWVLKGFDSKTIEKLNEAAREAGKKAALDEAEQTSKEEN